MAEFDVKPPINRQFVEEEATAIAELVRIYNSVDSTASNLGFKAAVAANIKHRLRNVCNSIDMHQQDMTKLKVALSTIMDKYEATEMGIMGQEYTKPNDHSDSSHGGGGSSFGDDGINDVWDALDKFLDMMTGEEWVVISTLLNILNDLKVLVMSTDASLAVTLASTAAMIMTDMWNDLQAGASYNNLIADFMGNMVVGASEILAGEGAKAAIIAGCEAIGTALPGVGNAIMTPVGFILGNLGGSAAAYVVDLAWNADWDGDGQSNKAEAVDGLKDALDFFNPGGTDDIIKIDPRNKEISAEFNSDLLGLSAYAGISA